MKAISRSSGRSATAAAAYRAASRITDTRTGEVHDYRRKGGVRASAIVLPSGAPQALRDQEALWNDAELAERRKNSTVAREFVVALPHELPRAEQTKLAFDYTKALVKRYGFAAEVSVHEPDKKGDQRNVHAHILVTTRKVTPEGFGEKTRVLDDRKTGPEETKLIRKGWETLVNRTLKAHGLDERVDSRSYADQGIDQVPGVHLGPTATAIERKTGKSSEKRINWQERATDRLAQIAAQRELVEALQAERELDPPLIDLETGLEALRRERAKARLEVNRALYKAARAAEAPQAQSRENNPPNPPSLNVEKAGPGPSLVVSTENSWREDLRKQAQTQPFEAVKAEDVAKAFGSWRDLKNKEPEQPEPDEYEDDSPYDGPSF